MDIQTHMFRDGVSQRNRMLKALEPGYISVDERSISDLLKFAQQYAEALKYYDESYNFNGNWSPFFAGDIQKMVAYINHPETFVDDEWDLRQFSQPHLVLFFTFLQLLRYPQQQFQQLTQRYLDFYYKEVLQLTTKGEIPDKVHCIFHLAKGEKSHLLKKGTLLNGGKDSQGVDLNYATDEDIILNQAQVASIKTLSVRKSYVDLKSLHQQDHKSDGSFEQMLRWAVGSPNQGDHLAKFGDTAVDINDLKNLYQEIRNLNIAQIVPEKRDYILNQLFFATIEDFKYCLKSQINKNTTTDSEWNQVYELVERAYQKKINRQRRNILEQEHQTSGFESMMRLALGHPHPGDSLPEMPNRYNTTDDLFNHLSEQAVVRYIKEQLYLSVEDFRKIMEIKNHPTGSDWEEVYRLVEKAQSKKRNFTYPPIIKKEIQNIYATSILEVKAGETSNPQRFETFQTVTQTPETVIGFAIASPVLVLQAGTRKITLTLACQENTLNREVITDILGQGIIPFDIYLSNDEQWLQIQPSSIGLQTGDFIWEQPLQSYSNTQISLSAASPEDSTLTRVTLANGSFPSRNQQGQVLIWSDGKVFKVTEKLNEREVNVQLVGYLQGASTNQVRLYRSAAVYLNSLQLQLTVDADMPAILPLKSDESTVAIDTPYPIVKILLKNVVKLKEDNLSQKIIYYEQLKSIRLEKVNIQVDVQNLQQLQLRNENSVLNAKSPFLPFGSQPKVGYSFYFANKEVCSKKLDRLSVRIEWMGLPGDFTTHYQAYLSTGILTKAIANNSFRAGLKLLNNNNWLNIAPSQPIFTQNGNTLSNIVELNYQNFSIPNYTPNTSALETDTNDPFGQTRYFKLELENSDFGHDLYPLVLSKVAISRDDSIRTLTVYPPYTPEVKAVSLNYSASVEIDLSAASTDPCVDHIFQLHPFGYVELNHLHNQQNYLLPQYEEEGALFIGIRNLQPPQNLSLLFQMMPGSANVELTQPQIHWSYLSGDRWQDFQETQILSDTTNGLVDAGIIRLSIPEAATDQNHMLPHGLHWLRATVRENAAAIPDTLDIKAQAVSATFVNQGNAADHLSKPLARDSIQALVTRDSAIKTVMQPYSSFQGKMKEDSRAFNTRVSERLRHKQRALTPWDYERLVLERFPEIYKVKCITSALGFNNPSEAKVTVVVVPDIANTAPFFPLEPKAPLYLLKEIEAYLKAHTSPFVRLIVKNPRYERIKYRVSVRFRPGYEQGYYLKQLNEDITRFLSPWAYEGQGDITFGSSIHSSLVIHFIEKRPYVDYVANLRLIEQVNIEKEPQDKSELQFRISESNIAQVRYPDSILVSATEHMIDVITTEKYQDANFEGIGYMIIGFDFIVR